MSENKGLKYDDDKLRWDLLPHLAQVAWSAIAMLHYYKESLKAKYYPDYFFRNNTFYNKTEF